MDDRIKQQQRQQRSEPTEQNPAAAAAAARARAALETANVFGDFAKLLIEGYPPDHVEAVALEVGRRVRAGKSINSPGGMIKKLLDDNEGPGRAARLITERAGSPTTASKIASPAEVQRRYDEAGIRHVNFGPRRQAPKAEYS